MAIQHRDITGNNIHEPKGVDTAPEGLVYVSSGSGSGAWTQLGSKAIKGLPSTNPVANQVITTDGNGGFTLGSTPLYGSLTMNVSSLYSIGTSPDTPPATPSLGNLSGITSVNRGLRVPITGVYKVTANASSAFSVSGSPFTRTVTYRIRKNGSTLLDFSQRTFSLAGGAGGTQTFSIDTYIPLSANEYIEPVIYVDNSANNFRGLNSAFSLSMQLVR